MTTNETFEFNHQAYTFEKDKRAIRVQIRRADLTIKAEEELHFLSLEHPFLCPNTYEWQEDYAVFNYSLPEKHFDFMAVAAMNERDKLRAMMNVARLQQLQALPIHFFIHPQNIIFDYNLIPQVIYRGIKAKMPPVEMNEADLLRQYKAYIIALFNQKTTFEALYEGNLERMKGSEFERRIIDATSFAAIEKIVHTRYYQKAAEDQLKNMHVPRVKYRTYKQLTIWLCVALVLLALPLGYLAFVKTPHQTKLLTADTSFLKQDYEAVIATLEPIETAKLVMGQKYELAYAFIQGIQLADTQKKNILNTISLKSNSDTLDYWIENGRGNLDEALALALKLEDPDLILYGYQQLIEQVKNDTTLSNEERTTALDKYQSAYDKYQEELTREAEQATEEKAAKEKAAKEKTETKKEQGAKS